MNKEWSKVEVKAWEANNFLLETYSYSLGRVEPLASHVHPEYQFALSPNQIGVYFYRGRKLQFPVRSLCVLHGGEPHAPSDEPMVTAPAVYRMLYVKPEDMLSVANELAERQFTELPYFPQIVFQDRELIESFLNLFPVQNAPLTTRLETDERQLGFLARLISRYAQNRSAQAVFKANAPVVKRATDFLHSNFLLDISLDEIAQIAGVNKFYLCRAFRRQTGISPHLYQNQLRLSHAKKLLLGGASIAETAATTGFYDQSHFGKYFKRLVGVSPKVYVAARSIFS